MARKKKVYTIDASNSRAAAQQYLKDFKQKRQENPTYIAPRTMPDSYYRSKQAEAFNFGTAFSDPIAERNKQEERRVTLQGLARQAAARDLQNRLKPSPNLMTQSEFTRAQTARQPRVAGYNTYTDYLAHMGQKYSQDYGAGARFSPEQQVQRAIGRIGTLQNQVAYNFNNRQRSGYQSPEDLERRQRIDRADLAEAVNQLRNGQTFLRNNAPNAEMDGYLTDAVNRLRNQTNTLDREKEYYGQFRNRDDYDRQMYYADLRDRLSKDPSLGRYESTERPDAGNVTKTQFLDRDTEDYYADTGFGDTLYDYVNRNPLAIERQRYNDARNYTTHSAYDDLDDETIRTFNTIYKERGAREAYQYLDSVAGRDYTKMEAFGLGLMSGMGIPSIATTAEAAASRLAGDEQRQEANREWYGSYLRAQQDAAGQHRIASGAGSFAGNMALMGLTAAGAGKIAGTAAGKALLNRGGRYALAGATSALTFAATTAAQEAGQLATGYMEGSQFGKDVGVSALAGGASAIASMAVAGGIQKMLISRKAQTGFNDFLKNVASSLAGAGVRTGIDYMAQDKTAPDFYVRNYQQSHPGATEEEIQQAYRASLMQRAGVQLATAFAFSIIGSYRQTLRNTRAGAASIEKEYRDLEGSLKAWSKIHPESQEDMDVSLNRIIEKTVELKDKLNSSYFAGQQGMVNEMNSALDGIIDSCEGYRYAASGTGTPNTGATASPEFVSSVAAALEDGSASGGMISGPVEPVEEMRGADVPVLPTAPAEVPVEEVTSVPVTEIDAPSDVMSIGSVDDQLEALADQAVSGPPELTADDWSVPGEEGQAQVTVGPAEKLTEWRETYLANPPQTDEGWDRAMAELDQIQRDAMEDGSFDAIRDDMVAAMSDVEQASTEAPAVAELPAPETESQVAPQEDVRGSLAETLGENGARAYLESGASAEGFKPFAAYYNHGLDGRAIPESVEAEAYRSLTSDQISSAVRAGAADANKAYPPKQMEQVKKAAESVRIDGIKPGKVDRSEIDYSRLTPAQKLRVDLFGPLVSQAFGLDVKWTESPAEGGSYQGAHGSITTFADGRTPVMTLDVNAGMKNVADWTGELTDVKAVFPVVSHELTHRIEAGAKEHYAEIRDSVLDALAKDKTYTKGLSMDKIIDLERKRLDRVEGGTHSIDQAKSEIVARACEDMMSGNEQVKEAFSNLDESTRKTIWQHIQGIFEDIKEFFAKMLDHYKSNSREAQAIRRAGEEFVEKIRRVWADGLKVSTFGTESTASAESTTSNQKRVFSMRDSVEETRDLIALHNLTETKLGALLEYEGIPMPSIAITKADIGHENFGDISLVFRKETIDPAKAKNKVYSADVWSPTFPAIQYEANEAVSRRIYDKFSSLSDRYGRENVDALYKYAYFLDDAMNRNGGVRGIIEQEQTNRDMAKAFLYDTGKGESIPQVETTETKEIYQITDADREISNFIIKDLGKDFVLSKDVKGRDYRSSMVKYMMEKGLAESDAKDMAKQLGMGYFVDLSRKVRAVAKGETEAVRITTKTDSSKRAAYLEDTLSSPEYKKWLSDLFEGAEKRRGIYNGKDPYTSSGNRRSFTALHYDVNAANIVKAMLSQNGGKTQNASGFVAGIKSVRSSAAKRFKSIEEIRKAGKIIENVDSETYQALEEELGNRMYDIFREIRDSSGRSESFGEIDSIGETLIEAIESGKTSPADMIRMYGKYNYALTDGQAAALSKLVDDVKRMPVNLFEAKPERVVDWGEIAMAVLPDSAPMELANGLAQKGVQDIRFYNPDDQNARRELINSKPDVRFSERNASEDLLSEIESTVNEERDKEYMEAVKSDDMVRARRLVQKAASDIPTIAKDDRGKPLHLYHGTPRFGFTEFVDKKNETPFIYTSTDQTVSAHYAGDQNYAFTRSIGRKYLPGNNVQDIIQNAKSVYGEDYTVMTREQKRDTYDRISREAIKIADKFDDFYEKLPDGTNSPDNVANAISWIYVLFGDFRDSDYKYSFDSDDGGENQIWRENFEEDIRHFEESRKIVYEYYQDNYDSLSKEAREYYRFLTGNELGDVAIDIMYPLSKAAREEDVLISKHGNLALPDELKERMDLSHDIGAYDLYGDLGDRPFTFDADGAQFWALKVPEMGEGYYSTDQVCKWAKEHGYTSVVMKNIYDYGDKADNYVFFDSSQLKSADPVTYDDAGDVIPISQRFNPETKDIRYSTRDEDNEDEINEYIASMMDEKGVEHLFMAPDPDDEVQRQQQIEYIDKLAETDLAAGTMRTELTESLGGGDQVDAAKTAGEVATALRKEYGSKTSHQKLSADIEKLYTRIGTALKKDAGSLEVMAASIGAEVLDGITSPDESMASQYPTLRSDMKKYRLYVSEKAQKDMEAAYDTYGNFRRAAYGSLTLESKPGLDTIGVDVAYQELSDLYPELFPAEIENESEQLATMLEVSKMLKGKEVSALSYMGQADYDQQAIAIGRDIISGYFDAAGKKAYSAAIREEKARLRKKFSEEMAEFKKRQKSALNRKDIRIEHLKQAQKDRIDRMRYRRDYSEAAQKLLKAARRLKSLKKKGSPDFQKQVDDLIGGLDLVAPGIRDDTRKALEEMRASVRQQSAQDPYYAKYHAPKYDALFERLEKKQINDMSLQDIIDLTEQVSALENSKRTYDREIKEANGQRFADQGRAAVQQQAKIKKVNYGSRMSAAASEYVLRMLNPVRAFAMLDGYQHDGIFQHYAKELNDGQTKAARFRMEVEKLFHDIDQDPALINDFSKQVIEVDTADGKVKISKGMRIALYLHNKNRENVKHIAYGGITIPDEALYKRGEYTKAYTSGKTVHLVPWSAHAVEDAARIIDQICAGMTDGEKKYADIAYKFFNEVTKKAINETSMLLDGYEKAVVEDYFPIKSDPNFLQRDMSGLVADGTIEGLGMLKERTGSSNPILLEDVARVVLRQTTNTAAYYGLAIPIRNFNRFYDYTASKYETSARKAVAQSWGKIGQDYISNVVQDLQFGRQTNRSILDTFKGVYAGATLNLNLGVAIKQSSSYPFAAAVIGWEPIIKNASKVFSKADYEYMDSITPWGYMRRTGFSGTEMGEVAKQRTGIDNNRKIQQIKTAMDWIRRVDVKTTDTLFFATEDYVRAKHPNLEVRGKEYNKILADTYNDVLQRTQPSYDVMQRNDFLRDQTDLMKVVGMFKTQTFNMGGELIDAYGRWRAYSDYAKDDDGYKKEAKKAREDFGRVIGATVASQWMLAILSGVANSVMHKMKAYRDKETGELTKKSVAGKLMYDFLTSFAGMTLMGAEIQELGIGLYNAVKEQKNSTYDLTYPGLDMVNELRNALIDATSAMSKAIETGKREDVEKVIPKVSKAIMQALRLKNIPSQNIYSIFNALYLWGQDFKNQELGTFEAGKGWLGLSDTSPTATQYAERTKQAIASGDFTKAEKAAGKSSAAKLKDALGEGESEDKKQNVLQSLIQGSGSGEERVSIYLTAYPKDQGEYDAWNAAGGRDFDYLKYKYDLGRFTGDDRRGNIVEYIKKQTSDRKKQKLLWFLAGYKSSTFDKHFN